VGLLIDWAKTKAKYQSESQREEVVKLYERALKVYCPSVSIFCNKKP